MPVKLISLASVVKILPYHAFILVFLRLWLQQMNNEYLQANAERGIILIQLTVHTTEMCKLSLDPGGGKEQMNLGAE